MTSNADRFLDAFAAIERHLRRLNSADSREAFTAMVKHAAERDALVRRCRDDLIEYAELRNAIVHDRRRQPIADPFIGAVEDLERIRDLLLTPPRVDGVFRRSVESTTPDERIDRAAARMRKQNYTQVPVYDQARFVGLLTGDTIARWLAAQLESDDTELIEEQPVSAVLTYTEDPSHQVAFLGRSASVAEALDIFNSHSEHGWVLHAILLTEDGRRDLTPLGIITTYDIPTALKTIKTK